MSAVQPWQKLAHGGDRCAVVDIVEDHEPGWVGYEPAQGRRDPGRVVARLLFRQIENIRTGEGGEARVEAWLIAGADEQKRRIIGLARPAIFDREPRLADPAKPMQRHCATLGGEKGGAEVFKRLAAPGEQAAERKQREIAGFCPRRRSGRDQRVEDRRGEDLLREIVSAGKRRAGIEVGRSEAAQVLGLRRARRVGRPEAFAALHPLGRRDDDEVPFGAVLVEADREPCLPLGIGQRAERLARQTLVHEPRRKVGPATQKIVDAVRLWSRTGHVANEMNDDVATLDIGFQHGERVAAERMKILLDLDLDIRPRQRMAQALPIVAELVGDTGEKEFYVRHSPPPMAVTRIWHGAAGSAKVRGPDEGSRRA